MLAVRQHDFAVKIEKRAVFRDMGNGDFFAVMVLKQKVVMERRCCAQDGFRSGWDWIHFVFLVSGAFIGSLAPRRNGAQWELTGSLGNGEQDRGNASSFLAKGSGWDWLP